MKEAIEELPFDVIFFDLCGVVDVEAICRCPPRCMPLTRDEASFNRFAFGDGYADVDCVLSLPFALTSSFTTFSSSSLLGSNSLSDD